MVPKKTGEFRTILDLRSLNQHIACKKFHMLTIKQLLGLVQPGDWFTTIDLKNAYFHGEIAPRAQKVFAFCLPGGSLRVQQTAVRLLPIPTHVQP